MLIVESVLAENVNQNVLEFHINQQTFHEDNLRLTYYIN